MMSIIRWLRSAILLGALASLPAIAGAEAPDNKVAVARVNGKVLFMDQLAPVARTQKHRNPDDPAQEQLAKRRAIERLIDVELLSQQARNCRIPDLAEKVNARIAELRQTRPAALIEQSETRLRELLADEILVESYLQQKGIADPDIPEGEIRALYDKGRESFRAEEAVRLCHISMQLPATAPNEEKLTARKMLEHARRRMLAGEAVAKAAGEIVQRPDGSQGELDFATRREMPEAIGNAAFSLAPDSVSEIIETPAGIHLVKVLERRPARIIPYEEMRGFLRKYLQEERRRQVYQGLLRELRQQANIEILPEPG